MMRVNIGHKLREMRGERTLVEAAAELGLSAQWLCDLENDRRDVRLSTVGTLAEKYGVTLAELLALCR